MVTTTSIQVAKGDNLVTLVNYATNETEVIILSNRTNKDSEGTEQELQNSGAFASSTFRPLLKEENTDDDHFLGSIRQIYKNNNNNTKINNMNASRNQNEILNNASASIDRLPIQLSQELSSITQQMSQMFNFFVSSFSDGCHHYGCYHPTKHDVDDYRSYFVA